MNQHFFKSILVMLTVLVSVSACEKDTDDPSCHIPPQQQLPNPLPENALVIQIRRTELDHETFSYNTKGQVSQVRSQWQFVEGDPTQIKTYVYDFMYDATDKPVRINTSSGLYATYFYEGNRIKKTQELFAGGALSKDVNYVYANNRIVQEYNTHHAVLQDSVLKYRYDFSYDAKGNLNRIESYELVNGQQYKWFETIDYSDFDDKINPTSWMLRYPYLPQVRYQFNNPRKVVRTLADGQQQTTTYQYEYNATGLPISKHIHSASGGDYLSEYLY